MCDIVYLHGNYEVCIIDGLERRGKKGLVKVGGNKEEGGREE
jgi:hypothetical protein